MVLHWARHTNPSGRTNAECRPVIRVGIVKVVWAGDGHERSASACALDLVLPSAKAPQSSVVPATAFLVKRQKPWNLFSRTMFFTHADQPLEWRYRSL